MLNFYYFNCNNFIKSLLYKQLKYNLMQKIKFLLSVLLFFTFFNAQSQRVYSNEFLSIGVGARSLAMGNASVANVKDVTAAYWNPAGLVNDSHKLDLGIMHSSYFSGIANYDYFGTSYKVDDKRNIGLTLLRFGVDDIQNTLELYDSEGNIDYSRIKKFSVADYAFLLSYAQKSKIEGLNYGANVKVIHRIIGSFASAWGFGFDIGAQYNLNKWKFGANLRDATSTFNAWTFNSNELEIFSPDSTFNTIGEKDIEITTPKLLLGAARSFTINDNFNLLTELDADFSFDGKKHTLISNNIFSFDPHMGLELLYKNALFFRAGLNNMQKIQSFDKADWTIQPNIGIGIQIKNIVIDYALTNVSKNATGEYSHVFSLNYFFH